MENVDIKPPVFAQTNENKTKNGSFLTTYLLSFFIAIAIVFIVYLSLEISRPITYKSKASEYNADESLCIKDNIVNPSKVTAKVNIDGKEVEVKNGDTIKAGEITFEWQPITNAYSYYVLLSNEAVSEKGIIDPVTKGKEIKETKFTALGLESNTKYYFLIRTKSTKKNFALVFPTPGNCNFVVAALPVFQFTNQSQ